MFIMKYRHHSNYIQYYILCFGGHLSLGNRKQGLVATNWHFAICLQTCFVYVHNTSFIINMLLVKSFFNSNKHFKGKKNKFTFTGGMSSKVKPCHDESSQVKTSHVKTSHVKSSQVKPNQFKSSPFKLFNLPKLNLPKLNIP